MFREFCVLVFAACIKPRTFTGMSRVLRRLIEALTLPICSAVDFKAQHHRKAAGLAERAAKRVSKQVVSRLWLV